MTAGWVDDRELGDVTDLLGSGAFVVADPAHDLGFREAGRDEVSSWWADGPSLDEERER